MMLQVFPSNALFSGVAGLLLLSLSGVLQRMMHGAADIRPERAASATAETPSGAGDLRTSDPNGENRIRYPP
jgi:hypothetical protein